MSNQSARRRAGSASLLAVSWPVCSGSPPAITDFFSPRPETGYGLDAGLGDIVQRSLGEQQALTVLVGPSGFGKTHLAAAVLRAATRLGRTDLQVWVNASSPSAVVMGYARAAEDISLTDRGVLPDAAAARFLDWLGRTDERWLVVLGNVTASGGLRGLWPAGLSGQTIVTCHPSADMSEVTDLGPRICRIGEFSPREALGYLTARLYDEAGKRVEAVDLAADLGYMPLALALATTTIASTALDCRQYRIRFASRRQELLGRAAGGQVSPAEVAWSLAVDRADQYPPAGLARPLLALAGLAGDLLWLPEPHPVLIKAGQSLNDAGLAGAAVAYWKSMLAASSRALGPEHPRTLEIRDLLAGACETAGRLDEARELILMSLAEREQVQGPEHPDALTTRAALARIYRAAGRYDAAIDTYARVVSDREWVVGRDHADTLGARSQLANTYLMAGQAEQAIALYQRNLADWEQALGPEHHDVLNEYMNLGRAFQVAGRLDEDIAIFSRVRKIRESGLGQDPPDTVIAAGQLAHAYKTAGRLKEAISLYRQVLASREGVVGADHPDTLVALGNLASSYHSAHRMKDAIPLYERLVADRERVQGPDHRDTLTARANLAGAYHSAGRLADALPVYEQAVADFERVPGSDHADTLTSRGNLAHAYYMARRLSDAIRMFERTIADSERAIGPDHPLTKTISYNLRTISRLQAGSSRLKTK